MANSKISDLTAQTSLASTDMLVVANAAGTTKKITAANLKTDVLTAAQPVDSDLTAIAALTTTSYGRSLLTAADAAAAKATLTVTERSPESYLGPTGSIGQSFDRRIGGNAELTITGATLYLLAVYLPLGQTITSLSFISGGTALSIGTNQWFGIFSSARVPLRFTSDDTSTAWGTNAVKTLSLTTTYTTVTQGLHYMGVCVKATTPPKLRGCLQSGGAEINQLAPIMFGASSGTLTDPASCPNPAGAISQGLIMPYCYWT